MWPAYENIIPYLKCCFHTDKKYIHYFIFCV